MPELPEVETTCRGITPHLHGQTITDIRVYQAQLRWPIPVTALTALISEPITHIQRRAKYIQLYCHSAYILLHLGMSGSLRVVESNHPRQKHDHLDIVLSSGKILRFHDPRRFGCCLVHPLKSPNEHKLLANLGIEPLTDEFTGAYLHQRAKTKKQAIKTFIMDNHQVVGIGNIYACESLFKAGINPTLAAEKVSLARFQRLVDCIKTTLTEAIQQGGTTLQDFVNSDGKPGYFQQKLQVYARENQACYQCGRVIYCIKQGQRSTYYCRVCQK